MFSILMGLDHYHMHAITTNSWFETALDLGHIIDEYPCLFSAYIAQCVIIAIRRLPPKFCKIS